MIQTVYVPIGTKEKPNPDGSIPGHIEGLKVLDDHLESGYSVAGTSYFDHATGSTMLFVLFKKKRGES